MPIQEGPTPWWQLPGMAQKAQNLDQSTPAGYTYDKVKMAYTPIAGSAQDQWRVEQRNEGMEDADRYAASADRDRAHQYQDEDRANQASLFGSLKSALSGIAGSFGSGFGGTGSPSSGSPIPSHIALPGSGVQAAADAAHAASFGKAKAQAGSMARSSVDTLRAELADRGIVGSGVEGRGLVRALSDATNPLSDLNTAQLHENVGITQHNQDLANQNAQVEYQGGIAQRGQDISAEQARATLAQQKQQGLLSVLTSAMQGLGGAARSY